MTDYNVSSHYFNLDEHLDMMLYTRKLKHSSDPHDITALGELEARLSAEDIVL